MKRHQIVVVSQTVDPDTDIMMQYLRELGHEPVRLHRADLPQKADLTLSATADGWNGRVASRLGEISLEEVRSIWWRRPGAHRMPKGLGEVEGLFAQAETERAARGIWSVLEDCYWVSFPDNIRKAENKISQLRRAAGLGLETPRTIVSNEPERVREFYGTCDGNIVYKTLSSPFVASVWATGDIEVQCKKSMDESGREWFKRTIYTTPLREQDLELLDSLRTAPGLFQEYVPKRVELRVTVIGDEVFTAELQTQAHEATRHDFRHWDVDFVMAEHRLPDDIAAKCVALTRSYGLNFSTSDFILTPDGRYVYLETNPNGQWLWVQGNVPSLKMKEAFAACLIRGANS
jgi:glutathione synthase/RimK-type ligase-like ATP-grasp enzyme